jgi:hypothetical protein
MTEIFIETPRIIVSLRAEGEAISLYMKEIATSPFGLLAMTQNAELTAILYSKSNPSEEPEWI